MNLLCFNTRYDSFDHNSGTNNNNGNNSKHNNRYVGMLVNTSTARELHFFPAKAPKMLFFHCCACNQHVNKILLLSRSIYAVHITLYAAFLTLGGQEGRDVSSKKDAM